MLWGPKTYVKDFDSFTIDSATKAISLRFTAMGNYTITGFSLRIISKTGNPPDLKIYLYSDSSGNPDSELASGSTGDFLGYRVATFDSSYLLTAGTVYHCMAKGQSGYDGSNNVNVNFFNRS